MNKIIAILVLCLIPLTTDAALCKTITKDGKQVFMFKANKPTKTLSGTVATLPLCPELTPEIVRKIVTEEYKQSNPVNDCERTAINVCEPSFGGVPLCTTNNFEGFCGFCLVTTRDNPNDELKTLRYLNGQLYDGSKINGETISCPHNVNKVIS